MAKQLHSALDRVVTNTISDAAGRRKSTTDRISAVTSFTYTALGQLASLTDAESQTTSYTYDSRGSKLTETYPDHTSGTSPGQTGYGIVTFVYDNAGRVKRKQDQLGDTVTFTFDLAGRMTTKDYRTAANSPTGTIADSDTFTFDRAGRMLTAVNGRYSNTVTYTFDPIGRKATEALTIGGQTYTITSEYNSRGELTKVTYPDSSISERTYHATGALNQLKLDGSTISTRTYDDGRRLTGETLGNGVTESRTYASDNLLTAISYGGTGTSIGNLSYTWDSNKNKTSETIGGTMSNYGFTSAGTSYDDEDRLTGFARASGTFTQSWSLTSVGDWNSITTNGTAQNRTHGPTHELLTAGGQNVTTDVKGNITLLPTTLTTSGVAMAVGYDFDNKLKSADVDNNGSNDVTFQYDALGRRVARQGTSGSFVYVQHDQQTIADYGYGDAPSSPTHRYVYASYIDEPVVRKAAGTSGTIHYYHRNQQFSITAVTTSSGSVAERYAYTAYGQPTILDSSGSVLSSSAINNRYTYTGREWDQTLGLYHFRARWMSGLAGRFMGRDPIGYEGSEWGLYQFVRGNPCVRTDPSGLDSISPDESQSKCVQCCCCPMSITISHGMDPAGPLTPKWTDRGWVKYEVKVKFTKINVPPGSKPTPADALCSLEFWEIPFSTIPASVPPIRGGMIPLEYTDSVWNDAVKLMRASEFFDPWEKFKHPQGKPCETKNGPTTGTVTLIDRPGAKMAPGGRYLYFYSMLRINGSSHPMCKCKPPKVQKIFMGHMTSLGWQAPTSDNSGGPGTPPTP